MTEPINKEEMYRRAYARMAMDYAERLARVRAGTHDPREVGCLFGDGAEAGIRWLERQVAYWTAISLGASPDPDEDNT